MLAFGEKQLESLQRIDIYRRVVPFDTRVEPKRNLYLLFDNM
jgi:hypothetical protein